MRVRRREAARGLALVCLGALLAACRRAPDPREMSVVLVTLDTTRADRIGAYGGRAVPTPNLDAIAREGVLFEQAITQVPLTLPAHASIFTGRYPASHGVRHNGLYRLPAEVTTLAEHLTTSGFETAGFVGAYVLNRGFGIEAGFETFDDIDANRFAGSRDLLFEAERPADDVNAAVFRWLETRRPGRFFLWVHYYDPHDPYRPPERAGRALQGSGYDREISYVDACFGDLVARLRSSGALDDALLVVVGDHGESLGEHGEDTHGYFLYEGAVRVPLIARAPGILPPGKRVTGPVELVDIAPTALDLLGLPPLPGVEGKSLRPRIAGEDDGSRAVAFSETLLPRLEYGLCSLAFVRSSTHKYVRAPKPELYDLRSDPAERDNLAGRGETIEKDLADRVARWSAEATAASSPGARRALSRDEELRLESLGYLGGRLDRTDLESDFGLGDPKDAIAEVRSVKASRERFLARDWEGALTLADEILRRNDGNHEARMTRILSLVELRRYREAEEESLAAVRAAEGDPVSSKVLAGKARAVLASVYRLEGKRREARETYIGILEGDPGNAMASVDYAGLLAESGDHGAALRVLDEVLLRDPRNGMALAARFEVQEAAGDHVSALVSARALADARTGDAETLVEAGLLLLEAEDPLRAASCFEVALAQLPSPDPELMGQLGVARLLAGRTAEARETFLAMTRLAPSDPRPHLYLGEIALRAGQESEGRAELEKALALDPRDPAPLTLLARHLASIGSKAEAVRVLEEALRRDPGNGEARQILEALRGDAVAGR